jgi:hypothetical protein
MARRSTGDEARLVRCTAGCGRLVWLKGALPSTADDTFVCSSCAVAAVTDGRDEVPYPAWMERDPATGEVPA